MSSYYTIYADPSDGWSNHWSNAEVEEDTELRCPICGETEQLVDDTPKGEKDFKLYICEACGDWFKI